MKIKVTEIAYDEAEKKEKEAYKRPSKQNPFMRKLMYILSGAELKAVDFTYETVGMDKLGKDEPALFLMNHSSFTDLQITAKLLKDRPYHIVMTNDGLIGKAGLMRALGGIPTRKFIQDVTLVKDMKYCTGKLKSSVLMFPEASYSFDGSETPLPSSLGKCVKLLGVPVVMIRTKGAFLRDPLYNGLRKRNVKVTATETYILSPEEIKNKSADEINKILADNFAYDHFKEQFEAGVIIDEDFRAEGLERALYKCCECGEEATMKGSGITIKCSACGCEHELLPDGRLQKTNGETSSNTRFEYVTDWYRWQREQVRTEIETGVYSLEVPVDIMMLIDFKSIYKVGEGVLKHNSDGFELKGCDGKLDFSISPSASYSLYADYFWYEIGDMISIGNTNAQYYCFPKTSIPVAKARLATEEMYKLSQKEKKI